MRRKLFTLAAAVSAVLCVAVAVLGASSYFPGEVRLGLADGRFVLLGVDSSRHFADDLWNAEGSHRAVTAMLLRHASTRRGAGGVVYAQGTVQGSSARGRAWGNAYGVPYAVFSIHCAYLLILLAVPPTLWLLDRRRNLRGVRARRCASCGYDLRATPDRCPECGAVPGAPSASGS